MLSGSAFSNWALAEQTELYTRLLASKVDCGLESSRTTPKADRTYFPNDELTDLFRSRFLNQTVNNNQLSSSDERIFQCLRSRSGEQLRTASIRLTGAYYSPFYSLFGPTIDSLLITDDQSFNHPFNHHRSNHSNHPNKKSKFAIPNSNHDLLIGHSANSPRLRPALKRMFKTLAQLSNANALHFFYQFLRDFVRYVNSLIHGGSLNDQNDFNEISILIGEMTNSLPLSSTSGSADFKDDLTSSATNSTNWLSTRQTKLLNIINSLLLDVLVCISRDYLLVSLLLSRLID